MLIDDIDGVAIGLLMGFEDGSPLVVFAGNDKDHAVPARSLTRLGAEVIGKEVALLFEDGNRNRPLIVGQIVDPVRSEQSESVGIQRDGDYVRVEGKQRIELRVGKAAILMEADGRITIRGTNVVSHASGANRMRGGSISLN